MKKIFTLIAMALMAVGVNAQTYLTLAGGWGTTCEDVVLTGDVTFNFKNAYACVNLISEEVDLTNYKGYELVLGDNTPYDKLQFAIKSDSPTGNSDGYNWSGAFTSTTPAAFIPEGATKLQAIEVQACNEADLGLVEIKSFNLIDNNDNKVATTYVMPASWAADALVTKATVNFTEGKQWQNAAIKGAEGLMNKKFTITCEEGFPADLQIAVATTARNQDNTKVYSVITAGATSHEVKVEQVEEGETITEMVLHNTVARDPFKVKGVQVLMEDVSSTDAINSVKAAAQQKGVRYNLAGQKVNGAYKGVVIENGKKVVLK